MSDYYVTIITIDRYWKRSVYTSVSTTVINIKLRCGKFEKIYLSVLLFSVYIYDVSPI